MTKILSAIVAAVVLFSAAQAQAFSDGDLVRVLWNDTEEIYTNFGRATGFNQVLDVTAGTTITPEFGPTDVSGYNVGFFINTGFGALTYVSGPRFYVADLLSITTGGAIATANGSIDALYAGLNNESNNGTDALDVPGESARVLFDTPLFFIDRNTALGGPDEMYDIWNNFGGGTASITDEAVELNIFAILTQLSQADHTLLNLRAIQNLDGSVTFVESNAQVIPVPAAVWLLGAGLGLVGLRRKA